ncbi:hypothetical protein PI126_g22861 [Phytophthora idaei]|nr:hypothetical protein PI126_g22861 [Phytophthora idaei]
MAPKRPGRTRGEDGKGRHQDMVKRRVDTYQSGVSFIFKPAQPSNAPAATATPLADLQTSTAVANELLALGQLDRVLGEVQEGSDVVKNAVAGVFEVLADDEEE